MTPKECTRLRTHVSEGEMELLASPGQLNVSIEESLRREMISYWDKYTDTEYPFEAIVVVLSCVTNEKLCHRVQTLILARDFFTGTLDDFIALEAEPNARQLCRRMGELVEPKDIIQFITGIGPMYYDEEECAEKKALRRAKK